MDFVLRILIGHLYNYRNIFEKGMQTHSLAVMLGLAHPQKHPSAIPKIPRICTTISISFHSRTKKMFLVVTTLSTNN